MFPASFASTLAESAGHQVQSVPVGNGLSTDGDVMIAAITSCTNTSNPSVLVATGLVAKAAHDKV